ncbi:RNA polymerase sigma factor, partial [bacterium]|nr:RNA polymerase sigma factor [bacterium]
ANSIMNNAIVENGLAEKINNGDADIFEEIMDRYAAGLMNFIYSYVRNREEAEDITQEVFFRLWKKREKYQPTAKLSTYLYRIAANLCIDYKRKEARSPLTYSIDEPVQKTDGDVPRELKESGPTPEEIIDNRSERIRVEKALEGLPAKQRMALILRTYENKNYQEIAEILKCSKPSVESLLFRARQNLKQGLNSD